MRGVSTMRLLFNLMTHTELSRIRVIPVLDHQSNKPLLSHNFLHSKSNTQSIFVRPAYSGATYKDPKGQDVCNKIKQYRRDQLVQFRGEATKKFSFRSLIRKPCAKNFMQWRSSLMNSRSNLHLELD